MQCIGDLNRGGKGFGSNTAVERQFKQWAITDSDHLDWNRLGVRARAAQWGQKSPSRGQKQANVAKSSSACTAAATGQLPASLALSWCCCSLTMVQLTRLNLSHGQSQGSLSDTVNENCVCWEPNKPLVGWFSRIGCATGNTAFFKAGIDFALSVQGLLLRSVQAEPGFWWSLLYSSCSSQGERSLLTAPQTPPTARTVLEVITFLSTLSRGLLVAGRVWLSGNSTPNAYNTGALICVRIPLFLQVNL